MARNDKFRRDITNYIKKSKAATDDYARAVVLNIDQRLVLKSPVDTGRFRANWNIGNGSVNMMTSEDVDPTGYGQIGQAVAVIKSMIINGQTIFISNSLPYAYRLEYEGWSKQAPQGMVRVTLAEINSVLKEAAFEVRR